MKRKIYLFTLMLLFGYALKAQNDTQVASFKESNDAYLKTLFFELQPAIYLNKSSIFRHGDGEKLVVITDAASLEKLYTADSEYSSVKLIEIRLSPSDESAGLDISRLSAFSNLKYIVFTYEYNACNDHSDDSCLVGETTAKVINSPDNGPEIFYLLAIRG